MFTCKVCKGTEESDSVDIRHVICILAYLYILVVELFVLLKYKKSHAWNCISILNTHTHYHDSK